MSDPFDNSGGTGGQTPPPFGAPTGSPGQFLPPPTQPVYGNPPGAPVYGNTPVTELVQGPSAPKRSRGKMVGALVAVAALLGAGAFAITKISDDDSASGGAASPEEVGDQFVKSLDGEDLLGIVDLLLPGERETFRDPLIELKDQLQRLEVTDDSVDLSKLPGLDITIKDPKVRAHGTNVDDISTINITGTAAVSVDGKHLPIGSLLLDKAFGGERPEVDEEEKEDDFDFTATTVKQDGHWYLSLFYSAANSLAGGQDVPEQGVQPVGADSPEGALDNLLNATGELNLEKIIAGLNPNEASALQRYAPLFLDDAQRDLDDIEADIQISGAQYAVTGSGDRRQVTLTAITVDASAGNSETTIELKDGCATVTNNGESISSCTGEDNSGAIGNLTDQLGLPDTDELDTLIDDLRDAFSDLDVNGVVVDKVDGKWFVSPIGTGAEVYLSVLRALDHDEIETLLEDGQDAFASIFQSSNDDSTDASTDDYPTASTFPDDTTDDTATDDTATDETATDQTATEDTSFDSTDDTVSIDTTTSFYDCLLATDLSSDEAAACIAKGIADGRFNRDDVPGPYQFPECGLFDYYKGIEIYDDSPEEFQSVIEPHLQCIVDSAAKVGADLTYTSPEFAHPECFIGVNPFNYSGDTDAISKAFECAYQTG